MHLTLSDFRPDSDVDVLVSFVENAGYFWDMLEAARSALGAVVSVRSAFPKFALTKLSRSLEALVGTLMS